MKARWSEFKQRHWNGRPAAERRILAFFTLILAPVFAYLLLWQPAHRAVAQLQSGISAMRAQAVRMHDQAAEVEALRHQPRPALLDAAALKTAVEESATRYQLHDAVSTLDTQEPNAVRITLASVSFAQWLGWLRDLERGQHIRADSVAIAALPQAGMVKISATLTNGETP
jgi:type II secretory pathway component PulM